MKCIRIGYWLITFLSLTVISWASVEGSISGTVTDPGGAVMPGALVTAINTANNIERTMTTGPKGTYSFQELPVGNYEIRVDAPNFKPCRRLGVVLNANSALLLDTQLSVGGRTETIIVEESPTRIDTADTRSE